LSNNIKQYNTMKTSFIKELKGLIINRLNDYKDTTHYACDLAHTLFEGENVDGSVFYNTYRTKEYIKKHFDLFGYLVEYCKDNFDMTLNPFQEPEKVHVILLLEGANSLLSKLPVIDENWNDSLTLDRKTIARIKRELKADNTTDEDLF
jgi:hypothetical protein